MRCVTLAVVFFLAAGSTMVLAQDSPSTLGAYFDAEGLVDCAYPVPYTPFDLYWILTSAEAGALIGYEFAWAYDPEITPEPLILQVTVPPGNLCDVPDSVHNMVVCLAFEYPTTDVTVLAHLRLLSFAPLPDLAYITVGPATPASIPGHAAILYAGATEPVPLAFAGVDEVDDQGWSVPGVAQIDSSCATPVAAQTTTWSNVKILFR